MTDTTKKQIAVLNRILMATDEEVGNVLFWKKAISEFGVFPLQWLKETETDVCFTENGMIQVPGELASFCAFISGFEIRTALELGVYRGRSSYFICAVLYRNNPELIYDMVDIEDKLDEFSEFQKVLPCLRKNIPATSDDLVGKEYDFVFIDADHSYDASIKDYCNVGRYAGKLLAFHDIFAHEYDAQNGGIVRTFKEVCALTADRTKMVFSQFYDRWMGIGVIINMESDRRISIEDDYETAEAGMKAFIRDIEKYEKLIVFGARNDSRRMFDALEKIGKNPLGLAVISKEEGKESDDAYPVCCLSELFENNVADDDTAIVIALRKMYRDTAVSALECVTGLNIVVTDEKTASFL